MHNKTCIIIVGPTAVGKTSLSIELARQFNTSIISADSRQCFIELNIGVAKPSLEQLHAVKHYFINSHHVNEEVNAAVFERLALEWADEIFKHNNVAVMVGGTGLYVKAFAEGLDEVPPSSTEIRNNIISTYNEKGIAWLQQEIKERDPLYFAEGEIHNPQRMMRALEVVIVSGKSILSFRKGEQKKRPFDILTIGLEKPKAILYEQINRRVDEMIEAGLAEEVRKLIPFRELNALQTVGYKELFEFFDGKIKLEKSIELIKQNTRHYAKRQLTWFKRNRNIHWFDSAETLACTAFVNEWLTGRID
jgi:tRNA dimethylallyltransferase